MLSVPRKIRRWLRHQLAGVRESLAAKVYLGLAFSGLVLAVCAVAAYGDGASWADTWFPNLITEWSGILIAVCVIERLLARHDQQERLRLVRDVERSAAYALGDVAEPLIVYTAAAYSDELLATDEATREQWVRSFLLNDSYDRPEIAIDDLHSKVDMQQTIDAARSRFDAWRSVFVDDIGPARRRQIITIGSELNSADPNRTSPGLFRATCHLITSDIYRAVSELDDDRAAAGLESAWFWVARREWERQGRVGPPHAALKRGST